MDSSPVRPLAPPSGLRKPEREVGSPPTQSRTIESTESPLELVNASCCVCGETNGEPIAVGEDFEYRTSPDTFLAVGCPHCGTVFLDPRPADCEFDRIYPDRYHAFDFSEEDFGLIYRVRRWLESRRLLAVCEGLPDDARILDLGCGDGFHVALLKEYGKRTWQVEGLDQDPRAVAIAERRGLPVRQGRVEELDVAQSSYDLVIMIMVIEHVADPRALLEKVRALLRPGGRALIITDNTGSLDFRLFRSRHWGGFHFPRHFYLFNDRSMRRLAERAGLEVAWSKTMASPVNWVYSIRNLLDDRGAPRGLVEFFTLRSPVALAFGTAWDMLHVWIGRGAVLRTMLRKPEAAPQAAPQEHATERVA